MMLPLYADMAPILIPIILVAAFGVIVIAVILLKRHVKIFKSDEKPKSDKEIAAEELDRLLQPIEDEEAAKQMNSYKDGEEAEEAPSEAPVEEAAEEKEPSEEA
ncbi:MAG: hypothetical protein K6F32_05180 [Bacilli bacterium]|nr:hypothetical protein [Bacilli bacterium]